MLSAIIITSPIHRPMTEWGYFVRGIKWFHFIHNVLYRGVVQVRLCDYDARGAGDRGDVYTKSTKNAGI